MSNNNHSSSFSLSFMNQPNVNDHEREKANRALIHDRYKDRFLALPKEVGWVNENLYLYQGFWHQTKNLVTLENVMATQETFQALPTDIYLATLPKSGTTWIKALAFAIINRSRYKINSLSTHPLHILNPHKCVPFVENEVIKDTPTYDVNTHSPRLFATHMPYTSLPRSILDSDCRLVYICRNPKDVLVSLFYFSNKLRDKSLGQMTFDEAFEKFTKGVISKGPYWDHVKGYHKASSEHPGKVLFLTYENMKRDDNGNIVKRLAEFMSCPFTKEEEAMGEVENIVRLCSFDNLSEMNKHGYMREDVPNNVFFRDGKVGDWTNHLTNEMSEILDQITKEKFHGLDISF